MAAYKGGVCVYVEGWGGSTCGYHMSDIKSPEFNQTTEKEIRMVSLSLAKKQWRCFLASEIEQIHDGSHSRRGSINHDATASQRG